MANQIDTDAKIIGEDVWGFGQYHVISDSTGKLYAVQVNDSNIVEVHKSINNGVDWTEDTNFSGDTVNPSYLTMCKSELDDIFICFIVGSGTAWTIKVKKRDHTAGTWSEVLSEALTSRNGGEKVCPAITYNRAVNRLHVFWAIHAASASMIIQNKYSDDKGSSWSGTLTYTFGSSSGVRYDTGIYGIDSNPSNGDIYVFRNIWHRKTEKFNSGGTRIGTESEITYLVEGGGLAIDSAGDRWIIWKRTASDNFYVWKNGVEMLNVAANPKEGMCSIGIDGSDNIYVFYTKQDEQCYYNKYDGSWVGEVALTAGQGLRPSCEQHCLPAGTKLNTVFYTD